MKTILYATDYSQNSVAALKYAHNMCLDLKVKLLVTHVFDYPTILRTKVEQPFTDLDKDAFRGHTTKLEDFCKEHLGSDLEKMNVAVEAIKDKSAVDGIVSKAEKTQSLLIVAGILTFFLFSMGIHGFMAHLLKPNEKGNLIGYPIAMGGLWLFYSAFFYFSSFLFYSPAFHLDSDIDIQFLKFY